MTRPSTSLLSPEQQDLLNLLGYVYLQHGGADRAVALFSAIHALSPDDDAATKSLACALIRSGKPQEAIVLLDRLTDAGDRSALVHLLRGQAFAALGRSAEAANAMQLFVSARASESARGG